MSDSRSILVVEDQAAERESLLRFLHNEGYAAQGAADGHTALEYADKPIDLVLCDVRMYPMTGIELLKEWKARQPATPFLLITAYGDIPAAVDAIKSGAADYLLKPVNPQQLLDKIDAAMQPGANPAGDNELPQSLAKLERLQIERTLEANGGNRTHAARALGISVRTLQRKLRAWNAEVHASAPVAAGGE